AGSLRRRVEPPGEAGVYVKGLNNRTGDGRLCQRSQRRPRTGVEEEAVPRPPAGSMARVRRANTAHVLRLLRTSAQPQRIAGIAAGTGLSRPTVEALAESLTRQGRGLASGGVPQGGRRSHGHPPRPSAV